MTLKNYLKKLPEVYQPIYKNPDLSTNVSRKSYDRLAYISKAIKEYSAFLGRKLNVLDIGCSQGFFSFSIAENGHNVVGIDYLKENIEFCNELKKSFPEYKINFLTSNLLDFCNEKKNNLNFDIVLGLSVFHHLIHENQNGIDLAKKIINNLINDENCGIFEFALSTEPVYWAKSQPKNINDLINNIRYNNFFVEQKTHLSSIQRPLIFSSNKYIYLRNNFYKIENYMTSSHELENFSHQGTRKYFFYHNNFLKTFNLNNKDRSSLNLKEYNNEVAFLQKKLKFNKPKINFCEKNSFQAFISRDYIKGERLDLFLKKNKFNPNLIFKEILRILSELDSENYFCTDIRLWNFVINDNKLNIIDYGSFEPKENNNLQEFTLKKDIVLIIYELFNNKLSRTIPFRDIILSPNFFEGSLKILVNEILKTNKLSIKKIQILFKEIFEEEKIITKQNLDDYTDHKSYEYQKNINLLKNYFIKLDDDMLNLKNKISDLEKFNNKLRSNFFYSLIRKIYYFFKK
jgi:O-antigen chain-terminating methyltransferase